MKVHRLFDPIWEDMITKTKCSKSKARQDAYKWLSESLSIESKCCHIGMFDEVMCNKAIVVLNKRNITWP